MSLHDVLARLAAVDDDATARVIAVALNADQAIRQETGQPTLWRVDDVKRVARALADHVGVSALSPRAAAIRAIDAELDEK